MAESLPAPMLARAVSAVPEPDSVPGGLSYEPKWDGFRGIVGVGDPDGDGRRQVEIGSRGSKSLTRYFPELVATFARQLPRCVLDGEIVLRRGSAGAERLDWEALSQRIHPAASRIALLAETTPAAFVAFDLLALGDDDLTGRPFEERRAALERLADDWSEPLHLCQTTRDVALARRWLVEFEGAGLDGVVASRCRLRTPPASAPCSR
jgi:ATP-dependent DNA ligase